jgi:iron complex transport system substrate-binding protein
MVAIHPPRPGSGPRRRATALAAAVVCALGVAAEARAAAPRIVSLNPSLTEILVAIGARDALVGVDDYSAAHSPEVGDLPRVGGLFSPSLEAVVALAPDVVVVVPSAEQRDFRTRLEALGVAVAEFDNIRFAQVLENIERLGAMVGHEDAARRRIAAIERARAAAESATRDLDRPRVLLVLQRDPVFVVGRGSFLDEMIDMLGAENLAREFDDPYPRVAVEWVVARGPEVVIDMSPDAGDALAYWSRWPSLPAVARRRVVAIDASLVSMPGPHLDRAIAELARGLHGDGIADAIAEAAAR